MGVKLLRSKGAGGDRFGVYHARARRQGWGWTQRKAPSYGLPREPAKSSVVCELRVRRTCLSAMGDGLAAVPIPDHCAITYEASRRDDGPGLLHFFATHSEMNRK